MKASDIQPKMPIVWRFKKVKEKAVIIRFTYSMTVNRNNVSCVKCHKAVSLSLITYIHIHTYIHTYIHS